MRSVKLSGLLLLLAGVVGVGCVRREIEILSTPPEATVQFDGQVLEQKTPVRFPFMWYGTHELIVEKEGYHRERLLARVRTPWYEWFPLDFLSENVWPGMVSDVRTYPFTLETEEPLDKASEAEKEAMKRGLLERADEFRKDVKKQLPPLPPPEKQ